MSTSISIKIGDVNLRAELNDSAAAKAIRERLPLTVGLSRWGDEYYGNCGLSLEADNTAREIMEVGEIALWPPGRALCVFFGPTPASTDEKPRAASPVIPVGRILGDTSPLKSLGPSIRATLSQ